MKPELGHKKKKRRLEGMEGIEKETSAIQDDDMVQLIGLVDMGVCPTATRLCLAKGQITHKRSFCEIDDGNEKIVEEVDYYPSDDEALQHGTMSAWLVANGEKDLFQKCSVNTKKKAIDKRKAIARMGIPGRMARFMVQKRAITCKLAAYQMFSGTPDEVAMAVEAAIDDRMGTLNIPISHPLKLEDEPYGDPMSLAVFDAVTHGILPCVSIGNHGPNGYVRNSSPGGFTIGASYSKRRLMTKLVLVKSKVKLMGLSINPRASQTAELVQVDLGSNNDINVFTEMIRNKIVVIDDENPPDEGLLDGAAGLVVIVRGGGTVHAFDYYIPVVVLKEGDGASLLDYMREYQSEASAIIKSSKKYDKQLFPELVEFCPQYPDPRVLHFLKPDITAPGDATSVSRPTSSSATRAAFGYEAGTSVATGFATAGDLYVRRHRPNWSCHARKSALMTTATPPSLQHPRQALVAGVGLINPEKAVDATGFVHDLQNHDYCKLAFGMECHPRLRERAYRCCGASDANKILPRNFNYPSMMTTLSDGVRECTFTRTATYVGTKAATFRPKTESISTKLSINVTPQLMHFEREGDTVNYEVTVLVNEWPTEEEGPLHGAVVWIDEESPTTTVRIKVAVLEANADVVEE